MLADVAAVLEDLGAVGELLRGHEVQLFQQRDVAVSVVVTLDPRKPVPVPHAAEVTRHLDDADTVDAGLLEIGAGQQSGEAAAENDDVDVFGDRVALDHRRVGVDLGELRELPFEFQVLRTALGPQTFGPFSGIPLPDLGDVDVGRGVSGPARVLGGRHVSPLPCESGARSDPGGASARPIR